VGVVKFRDEELAELTKNVLRRTARLAGERSGEEASLETALRLQHENLLSFIMSLIKAYFAVHESVLSEMEKAQEKKER